MALKGKQPEEVKKRLKMFIYGASGVGKTTTAISFPNCYLIDCEHGAENSQYLKILKQNNGAILQTSDFKEILQEVRSLRTEKHNYTTLIIDPVTTMYNNLVDFHSIKNGKDNTEYGRHTAAAKKQIKQLFDLLVSLDMNIILTAHAKKEYGDNMKVLGNTFDFFVGAEYVFDLVLEARKLGVHRTAHVIKTRIETFSENEECKFDYATIADKYGRDIMEAQAKPVVVGTKEDIAQLDHLITVLKISSEEVGKWFKKANVSTIEDMPQDIIHKIIGSLKNRVENKE